MKQVFQKKTQAEEDKVGEDVKSMRNTEVPSRISHDEVKKKLSRKQVLKLKMEESKEQYDFKYI